jgi:hypothetical protein
MKRTFIQTKEFSRHWDELGFSDQDLRRLENEILINPKVGNVIRGTGGLRKMRFAFEGRGKRSSSRVCYVDFEVHETVYLITVFAKADQENLTREERSNIRKVIAYLETELGKGE